MKNNRRLIAIASLILGVIATGTYGQRLLKPTEDLPDGRTPQMRAVNTGAWAAKHQNPPPPSGNAAAGDPGESTALFTDVAKQSGIDYHWVIAGQRPVDILGSIGNGCAFLDYDNDGNLDVLLVGPKIALYRGDGKGHFTDVSRQMRLDTLQGHFLGCAIGDYDNDGYDDIYLSGYRTGLLLHNDKGASFADVTRQVGLSPQPWGGACAWGDVDGDGRLDLYVGNYVKFDPAKDQRYCEDEGLQRTCGPKMYLPELGVLYRNEGQGRFQDVTQKWHASGFGKTLGAAFVDLSGNGSQSIGLANDEMYGNLLENKGGGFQDVGRESGFGMAGGGPVRAGMGLDWGDWDNDGHIDAAVMAFANETKSVYRNQANGIFEDDSMALTVYAHSLSYVAFGVKWIDYDNDGWLDLMIANGHVYDNAGSGANKESYRQPTQLFHNDRGRIFVDMSDKAGPDLTRPVVGRGLATGDFDNDGKVDALVVDSEGAPLLLHNGSAPVGHFVTLALAGTKSNRDGYGAVVTATAADATKRMRVCHADGSYFSSSDKRVHLGLGTASVLSLLQVKWPSGKIDTFHNVKADRFYTITEGSGVLK